MTLEELLRDERIDAAMKRGRVRLALERSARACVWRTIDSAPLDGSPIRAGKAARVFPNGDVWVPWPVTSRFIAGRWTIYFSESQGWLPYDPQPTHWQELPE